MTQIATIQNLRSESKRPSLVEGRGGSSDLNSIEAPERATVPPDQILEIAYAFWKAKVLLSAVELNLFTELADGPLDLGTLTIRLGLHERGARDFFDSLVALNLLARDEDGRYSNQADAGLYLDSNQPTYIGPLLAHMNARHYQNWRLLTSALRTGSPQSGALANGSYPALYADRAAQDIFLAGMTAGSLLEAQALARKFPWKNYRTFIDIGTAQGCVPVEIARLHSHLTGGGFDLPQVKSAFGSYVQSHGLANRLHFYAGDFFADPLPRADVHVMGRILHNWDLPKRKLLLHKVYAALPQGGALIVYDPMIDDARRGEPHALLSSLNMLLETSGGSEYSVVECTMWMREAGFTSIVVEPLGSLHKAVIANR